MESTLGCLRDWMPRQRWYADSGSPPRLRLVSEWDLGGSRSARVQVLLVCDGSGAQATLYQVPLVWRSEPREGEIARLHGSVLVDGAYDPAYQDILFRWLTRGGRAGGADGPLYGEPAAPHGHWHARRAAAVQEAERSDTSVIYRGIGPAHGVICRVFRRVYAGVHPDVELQSALWEAGVRSVAPAVGTLSGMWRQPGDEGHVVAGSLCFAQEFFPGTEDGREIALRAAAAGRSFAEEANRLGATLAETHGVLARLFPTREASAEDRERTAAGWRARLDAALAEIPALRESASRIEAVFARAREVRWPRLQRVHGDLDLGRALRAPGRGWVLQGFGGEPSRAISELHAPDLPVRDVAGMLRSFSVVAESAPAPAASDGRAEAAATRAGFLRGYEARSGAACEPALLRAFQLDRALDEAAGDARDRPDRVRRRLAEVERIATA